VLITRTEYRWDVGIFILRLIIWFLWLKAMCLEHNIAHFLWDENRLYKWMGYCDCL
jgi:hypothetical protein